MSRLFRGAGIFLLLLLAVPAWGAEARIDLELITAPDFPPTGAQSWIERLKGISNISLRIRAASAGEQEAAENRGTEQAPRYHVVGVLTSGDRLRLPGAEFAARDRAGIANWFDKLRQDGLPGLGEKAMAFGLNSQQLVQFHERVSPVLAGETRGRRPGDVARQIVRELGIGFEVTRQAADAFQRDAAVSDELQGLSSGTALAAALRPLGLALAPRKSRTGELTLLIAAVDEVDESWPVGWPPQDSPFKVAPPLFEQLGVEIDKRPLAEALSAIQQRVKMPFLLDHRGLDQQRVDPAAILVSHAKGRATYKQILDRLLFQAKLAGELRVDEAGTPFLWISGVRKKG